MSLLMRSRRRSLAGGRLWLTDAVSFRTRSSFTSGTEYQDWDEGSLERQQNLLAANPIQARLALLADLAVYRKLIHLASRELERLRPIAEPAAEMQRSLELLEEFQVLGVERVLELVERLSGEYLAILERRTIA